MDLDNATDLYEKGRTRRHNDNVSKADQERVSKGDDVSPVKGYGTGGRIIGNILGGAGGAYLGGPAGGVAGFGLGGQLGDYLPFKKGESVRSKKRNK